LEKRRQIKQKSIGQRGVGDKNDQYDDKETMTILEFVGTGLNDLTEFIMTTLKVKATS
jgi:hypothetical protein